MSNSREEELALLAGKYIGSGIQHVDMTSDVLIRKITDCLDDIKAFAKNSLTMNSVVERLDDMRTSLNSPLCLMIMGGFSVGKSSFINALLRQDVTAVNSTPTTAVVCKLVYGDSDRLFVHFKSGAVQEYTPAKFAELTAESDPKQKDFHKSIKFVLRTLPAEFLKSYTIIDTPGLNSAQADHTDVTTEIMNDADAVIWMFDARWAAGREDISYMNKLAQRLKPLVVVNQMDWIDPDEMDPDELLDDVKAKCGQHIMDVVGVSAKMSLEGIKRNNQALEDEGNISGFMGAIDKYFKPKVEKLKFEKMLESYPDFVEKLLYLKDLDDKENFGHKNFDYTDKRSMISVLESYCIEKAISRASRILLNNKTMVSDYDACHKQMSLITDNCTKHLNGFANMFSENVIYYCYADLLFLNGNKTEAWRMLNKSADLENNKAKRKVADYYYEGASFVEQDKLKAFLFYYRLNDESTIHKKFIVDDNRELAPSIAKSFHYGENCFPALTDEALRWYKLASEIDEESAYQASCILSDQKLYEKASEYRYDAAEKGHIKAILEQAEYEWQHGSKQAMAGLYFNGILAGIKKGDNEGAIDSFFKLMFRFIAPSFCFSAALLSAALTAWIVYDAYITAKSF